jgi:hypothetical protein
MGFRLHGENEDGEIWVEDVLRHSYASYWLAIHKNRAQLAENMGNSLTMFKKHYKQVVKNSDAKTFWKIVPGFDGKGTTVLLPRRGALRRLQI